MVKGKKGDDSLGKGGKIPLAEGLRGRSQPREEGRSDDQVEPQLRRTSRPPQPNSHLGGTGARTSTRRTKSSLKKSTKSPHAGERYGFGRFRDGLWCLHLAQELC